MAQARGSAPDSIEGNQWTLLKSCSELHLTYQIRLLTYVATQHGAKLVSSIPAGCQISRDLSAFAEKYAQWVPREEIVLQPNNLSLTNEMMQQFKEQK